MIPPTQWQQLLLVTLEDYEKTRKRKSWQRQYYDNLKLLYLSVKSRFWNLPVELCWLLAVWKKIIKTGAFKRAQLGKKPEFSSANSKSFSIRQQIISHQTYLRHQIRHTQFSFLHLFKENDHIDFSAFTCVYSSGQRQ